MHFTDGLSAVYRDMAQALKPGAPLAFTFHHNRLEAYHAVGVAILDAGLTCTRDAALPGRDGRLDSHSRHRVIDHRHGLCVPCARMQALMARASTSGPMAQVVEGELSQFRAAGMKPTAGDIRCMVFGHLTRSGDRPI